MLRAARTIMASSSSLRPIVAVVGTTGVGKSQLAVSLAQSLASSSTPPNRGVVLSADSMQLYKGLDVITNKVTEEEKGGIEHWGLDMVQPGEGGSWELGKWCSEAAKKVEATPSDTLPIICGGTHYFIQHFLFPPAELSFDRPVEQTESRMADPLAIRWTPPRPCPAVPQDMDPELKTLLDTFWTNEAVYPATAEEKSNAGPRLTSRPVASDDHQLLSIWRVLEAVDPTEAGRWHWRDGRKVRRGLERWWERGGGEVMKEERPHGESEGRRARFRTLIFWVYEPMETLRPRLDKRVDKMVENGLLKEIEELRIIAKEMYGSQEATDHSEGIFQAIGYKEFSGLSLPQEDPSTSPLFDSMLVRTKLSTHQYAKSQIKWVKKQLLPAVREARRLGGDVHLYAVPGGASGEPIGRDILSSFLSQTELPDPLATGHPEAKDLLLSLYADSSKVPDTADRQVLNARKICNVCSKPSQPFSVRAQEWDEHIKSKVHRRNSTFTTMTREEWIEAQKAKGLARKAERERDIESSSVSEQP